ncbi:hypothetical protein K7432_015163 [Basidiobolus ranarum]|uniref:Uncharacterized protein n=1 Tax=Basidiobolus ranarum TaxID=34480 RepID=A0ABR2VP17_9FUNG
MNCIDITINGGTPGGTVTGPKLMVANLPGYPTIPEMDIGEGDGHGLLEKRSITTVGATNDGGNADPKSTSTAKPSSATTNKHL